MPEPTKKIGDFAKEIRRVRTARHLSIAELALSTDIREGDLIKIEAGEKLPNMDALLKLKSALNVEIKFYTLKSDLI